ncbi:MAG: 4-hydroxyphenylacetate 3-hydroxylase [Rhodospirillaceae bacterium]|nr:4-hydroxyphenylacetate 3-hydroxylase [Rhodospirillaceae bacterium]
MLLTGKDYIDSIRDDREVWIDGEKVKDVPSHPAFKPMVDIRARVYDMAHEDAHRDTMTVAADDGEVCSVSWQPPRTKEDLRAKWRWVDAVMEDIEGVAFRLGDETIGAVWSLLDGRDLLDSITSDYTPNIERHIEHAYRSDLFTVSGNTDPKGDRSRPPQEQDPDMLLHAVKETDAGIIVRGAKYETAAAYSHQAFVKPTIANWGDAKMSDYALGFMCPMGAPGLKHICRASHIRDRSPEDYPSTTRFDEIDTLLVFDDVLIPWKDVFFYQHTQAAGFIRSMLHRYSALPFVIRILHIADLLIGAAMFNAEQTGLDKQPAVREKLATLAAWREGIYAHVLASIEMAQPSESGLMMPHQSMLYAGRIHACTGLPKMMHLARELVGGQICITPDSEAFKGVDTAPWMDKFYTVNDRWVADDRRKLLAYASDLVNSDHAGHRLTFALFAQSPPFAHLNAEYMTFDFEAPKRKVKAAAKLSDRVMGNQS